MSIDFNQLLKQADAAGFTVIPDGVYDCVVEKAESVTASTGKPMIKVTLVVEGGPHAKRKLFTNHVLTPDNDNALRFFFENMTGYGFGREYWTSPGASLDACAPALIGRRVKADVGNKEYPKGSGQFRNEVKKILPQAGQPGPTSAGVPSIGPSATPPAAAPVPTPAAVIVPPVAAVPPQSPVATAQVPQAAVPEPYTPNGDEEPF